MSMAVIFGSPTHGSHVHFFIGGKWSERLKLVVDLLISEEFCNDYDETLEELTKDIEAYNDTILDPANKDHYFYISSVDHDFQWYEHFHYVASGSRGRDVFYWNSLMTGEVGHTKKDDE